jgi:hypothetical protein
VWKYVRKPATRRLEESWRPLRRTERPDTEARVFVDGQEVKGVTTHWNEQRRAAARGFLESSILDISGASQEDSISTPTPSMKVFYSGRTEFVGYTPQAT